MNGSLSSAGALRAGPAAFGWTAVGRSCAEALLLLAVALSVRIAWLDAVPHIDELYHLLAAEGWLRHGEPRIAQGSYDRALLYTILTALAVDTLGPSLQAARASSVLFGLGLVLALFLWCRRTAGPVAAWTAGLLLALTPIAVEISQLTRFYALHALAFWIAAVCVFRLATAEDSLAVKAIVAAAALACGLLAWHLQMLTIVGGAGLGLWLGIVAAPHLLDWLRAGGPGRRVVVPATAVVAVGLGGLILIRSGLLELAWEQLRHAPMWAVVFQDHYHFYHVRLIQAFPLFWPVTGFLALAALSFRPQAASFCLCLFGVAFVVASLGGMKAERYLYYALPFLFALWGIGLAVLFERLRAGALRLAEAAAASSVPFLPTGIGRGALLGAALLFAVIASGAPAQLLFHLARSKAPDDPGRLTPGWAAAAHELRPWLESADVVVTSNELAALWWLGRADVVVNASRISELRHGEAHVVDPRTGFAIISSPDAVRRVVTCHREGLVIVAERDQGGAGVPRETEQAIAAASTRLDLPGLERLRVYHWKHAEFTPSASCAPLSEPAGRA